MEINSLLQRITPNLVVFLEGILPALYSIDWWSELVFNSLTFQQQQRVKANEINSLSSLDLAALLRILEKNFHQIKTKMNLPHETFNYVKEMQAVRNRWAHSSPDGFLYRDIYRDLDTLERFAEFIKAKNLFLEEVRFAMQTVLEKLNSNVAAPQTDKENNISTVGQPTKAPGISENDFVKIHRIKLWAKRSHQINHKIIMAFLELEKTGDVFLNNFKSYCSTKNSKYYIEKFDGHYASMKSDAGNSHGKVFNDDGNGVVTIYPRVREQIKMHFKI